MKTLIAVILLGVAAIAGSFFYRLDTYTAVVASAPAIDTDNGRTSKFIRVQPQTRTWLSGIDERGILKLKIADSLVPYFAWAVDGDRAEGLREGDVICVTDRGYRFNFFSQYPTFIRFTAGRCNE